MALVFVAATCHGIVVAFLLYVHFGPIVAVTWTMLVMLLLRLMIRHDESAAGDTREDVVAAVLDDADLELELKLVFQPIGDISKSSVVARKALARCDSPALNTKPIADS